MLGFVDHDEPLEPLEGQHRRRQSLDVRRILEIEVVQALVAGEDPGGWLTLGLCVD